MQVWANYERKEVAGCWPLSINRYSMTLRQMIRSHIFGFSVSVFVSISSINSFSKMLKSMNHNYRKFGKAFYLVILRYKCVTSRTVL